MCSQKQKKNGIILKNHIPLTQQHCGCLILKSWPHLLRSKEKSIFLFKTVKKKAQPHTLINALGFDVARMAAVAVRPRVAAWRGYAQNLGSDTGTIPSGGGGEIGELWNGIICETLPPPQNNLLAKHLKTHKGLKTIKKEASSVASHHWG